MGGLKLLHSTAKTGKRQMQTDGGINRWHMWRAHKPFLNSISSTSWTFGESSGFLVIRYRSAGARLWKTHKGTHSLSPFHTLHSLRGITQTSWDLIKKKKEEKNSIKRLLCEDTAGRRTEGMMREKEETWKRHRDFSEDKKKGGGKSMFHFSPLFGFIFPMWPCTTGEGEEKQNTARKSGKGHENEITHILKSSVYLTSEKHNKTPLMLRQHRSEQQLCPSERICRLYRVSAILSLFSNLPVFHLWFSEWRFPFCFIFKWRIFP